jgi:hypothetical protein
MAVNPIFDLGEESFKDYSIEDVQYYKILENQTGTQLSTKDTDTVRSLRFMANTENYWVNFGRSYIAIEGKFVKKTDGENYEPNDGGCRSLPNNLAAMVRNCTLKANGIIIEKANADKMIDVTLHDILNDDSEYANTYGSLYNYHKSLPTGVEMYKQGSQLISAPIAGTDYGNHFTSAICLASYGANGEPDVGGFTHPSHYINHRHGVNSDNSPKDSAVYLLPLNKLFHFFKAYDKIVRGIQFEIEFEIEPNEKIVKWTAHDNGTNNVPPKFVFGGRCAELYVERITPRLAIRHSLNQLLLNGFSKSVNYEDFQVYRQSFDKNDNNKDWAITTTVSRPTKLYIVGKWDYRDKATYYNSQTFDYLGMTRMYVEVNGKRYPGDDYILTPESGSQSQRVCKRGHERAVMDIMKMQGLDVSEQSDMLNRGSGLNLTTWNSHAPIFAFDLTKYPGDALFTGSSNIVVHFERETSGTLETNPGDANGPTGKATYLGGFTLYALLGYEKVVDLKMTQTESSIVIR